MEISLYSLWLRDSTMIGLQSFIYWNALCFCILLSNSKCNHRLFWNQDYGGTTLPSIDLKVSLIKYIVKQLQNDNDIFESRYRLITPMIMKHTSPKIFTVKERTVCKAEIITVLKQPPPLPQKKDKRQSKTKKKKNKKNLGVLRMV